MSKVVYVTGAPATGKSTLCRSLAGVGSGVRVFSYNEQLRHHVNDKAGYNLDESDIRRDSARVVTANDVAIVDDLLCQEVKEARASSTHLLIDSHPVTKEDYGFRITPFCEGSLRKLGIDIYICLFAAPDVLCKRISHDPQGRTLPSDFELSVHVHLQAAVVAQYAVLTGKACHLIHSDISRCELASKVKALTGI